MVLGLTLALAAWAQAPGDAPRLKLQRTVLAVQPPGPGWAMGMVSSVAVARDGVIYILQRGDKADPVIAVDSSGRILRSWGRGLYKTPHSIRVDPAGNIWTVDAGNSKVLKFSPQGEELLEIGLGGLPAGCTTDFCGATDITFASGGRIYISDGYRNARVLEHTATGKRVREWGSAGSGPGQFQLLHGIAAGPDDTLYVADRENGRVQRFNLEGRYLGEWSWGRTFSVKFSSAGDLWIGAQPKGTPNGAPGWLMKIHPTSGKVLGYVDTPGHHSVEVNQAGQALTGARPDQVIWFR